MDLKEFRLLLLNLNKEIEEVIEKQEYDQGVVDKISKKNMLVWDFSEIMSKSSSIKLKNFIKNSKKEIADDFLKFNLNHNLIIVECIDDEIKNNNLSWESLI